MAVVLNGRLGDVQCLKALVAASVGSSSVTFKPADDSRLSLVSSNASTLHQPNSIMLALGTVHSGWDSRVGAHMLHMRTASQPQPPAVLSLLEWEQQHLCPALYTRNDQGVIACLAALDTRIGSNPTDSSLGHLAVACDLLAAGQLYATQVDTLWFLVSAGGFVRRVSLMTGWADSVCCVYCYGDSCCLYRLFSPLWKFVSFTSLMNRIASPCTDCSTCQRSRPPRQG